jgi:hypothetical protein
MAGNKSTRLPGISIIRFLAVLLAAWNALRLGMALFLRNPLSSYAAHPFYTSISGAIWLMVGLAIIWMFWKRRQYSRIAILIVALLYSLWYWLDRILIETPHANWPFALAANVVMLALILLIVVSWRS